MVEKGLRRGLAKANGAEKCESDFYRMCFRIRFSPADGRKHGRADWLMEQRTEVGEKPDLIPYRVTADGRTNSLVDGRTGVKLIPRDLMS